MNSQEGDKIEKLVSENKRIDKDVAVLSSQMKQWFDYMKHEMSEMKAKFHDDMRDIKKKLDEVANMRKLNDLEVMQWRLEEKVNTQRRTMYAVGGFLWSLFVWLLLFVLTSQ